VGTPRFAISSGRRAFPICVAGAGVNQERPVAVGVIEGYAGSGFPDRELYRQRRCPCRASFSFEPSVIATAPLVGAPDGFHRRTSRIHKKFRIFVYFL
jgi:hypothetical protein